MNSVLRSFPLVCKVHKVYKVYKVESYKVFLGEGLVLLFVLDSR